MTTFKLNDGTLAFNYQLTEDGAITLAAQAIMWIPLLSDREKYDAITLLSQGCYDEYSCDYIIDTFCVDGNSVDVTVVIDLDFTKYGLAGIRVTATGVNAHGKSGCRREYRGLELLKIAEYLERDNTEVA